jgi:Secretion system C-terminal sorting domain
MRAQTSCYITILFLAASSIANAQIQFGANNYTEFRSGSLPLVISIPHGGDMNPSSIPDRTCNSAVWDTDANTIDLGLQIDSALFSLTGCHPYLVICHLDRAKLDCNRNLADGACDNAEAMVAWNEFNTFINQAQTEALQNWNNSAFYIDLHGHGNPTQRIELGYLLYDDELELPDATLNSAQYVGYSTIQNLIQSNLTGLNHVGLLKGENALGTLLGNAGYPSVPSAQIPFPGTTTNYYSGGYNVAHHTSYVSGNLINGVQMECNYDNVRDTYLHRKAFADSLAIVLSNYLMIHRGVDFSECSSNDLTEYQKAAPLAYPNPWEQQVPLHIAGITKSTSYKLINAQGQIILTGILHSTQPEIKNTALSSGIYFLILENGSRTIRVVVK